MNINDLLGEVVSEVKDFFENDFYHGVKELTICNEDRTSLLYVCKTLNKSQFGSYIAECSVEAEIVGSKKMYKLKIGFDKL